MKSAEAAKKASRLLGSQAEMARLLQVTAPTVNQWCSGERAVPAKRALQIEALTEGLIKKADLCPTFPWAQICSEPSETLSAA
ncbi:Cro/CI family transcriptional regulator [Pseudomonas sp. Irchel s3f7]|uniref:transcriptional regulator n=1 Tax=Pseudomonas sp. Irchel s3f7 TaxID=2009153 RepID=UPI000BA4B211|nr:Cro/CI family transcriptional regulator [Pseudomonas sp. Irchel s3f7]